MIPKLQMVFLLTFLEVAVMNAKVKTKQAPRRKGHPDVQRPRDPQGATGAKQERRKMDIGMSNWAQCAWQRSDEKDYGLIQNCTLNKKYDSSYLRVFYGGTLCIASCNYCCKRWYFTFNGAECKSPLAIDGILYLALGYGSNEQIIHRHRHIEGYCNNIPKGHVVVGFWVGDCVGYGNADANSGWNAVSRIVIEEVPPPLNDDNDSWPN